MKTTPELVSHTPLFNDIGEDDISSLLKCLSAREKSYDKDECILSIDSVPNEVGIVLSGSVIVKKEDYWGNRNIIAKIGAGGMFGETFSCARVPKMPVTVIAAEKSEIMFIDYNRIATSCPTACSFHSMLIQNMLQILAGKNLMLTQKIEHIVNRTTREKLMSYLSSQALKSNTDSFAIPFNRQELADYLSVDRSAMSNELCKLRDEGVLSFHKNTFTLH